MAVALNYNPPHTTLTASHPMLTGDLKNKIDTIWNAFWTGGIANQIEVIEQITFLIFIRRLDVEQTLEENRAARLKTPIQRRIFPAGNDPKAARMTACAGAA